MNLTCRIKEYIQPFERKLALQELEVLAPGGVRPIDGDAATATIFEVARPANVQALSDALTYWESVDAAGTPTVQVRREATSLGTGQALSADDLFHSKQALPLKRPKKRCLRYATHGMHEYRGKFFPQLVRALMNIAQVPRQGIVVDPMCGSGTTLVEARLEGRHAYGLDMNPLSVFISDAKCRALSLTPRTLFGALAKLQADLANSTGPCGTRQHISTLSQHDQEYLERWFAPTTLDELDVVHASVSSLKTATLRDFYLVCLSNLLRDVSWQNKDDLRIRRKVEELPPGEVTRRFLHEASRSTQVVGAFVAERGGAGLGPYAVIEADAREADLAMPHVVERADVVITSPPYATALPYLDTDRLSLIYLGLLTRAGHRKRDLLMIGNREITTGTRRDYWKRFESDGNLLPDNTRKLIERIHELNDVHYVGFRRRNLAALLSKYFFDMYDVIERILKLLKPGGTAFLVVGNNRTVAGGVPLEISTAQHLTEIAEGAGLVPTGGLSMDMLLSRDVFRKNAMNSEQIVALRKPSSQK